MIRDCTTSDFDDILEIINDAAGAYRGAIPADCWHDPYMDRNELLAEIGDGVRFQCLEIDGCLAGVMGRQDRGEVFLIRHAYVRTPQRRLGIGGRLLAHLEASCNRPVLLGTWRAATWAIDFYRKHGYRLLPDAEARVVLPRYWRIPERQIETSVVLANARYCAGAA